MASHNVMETPVINESSWHPVQENSKGDEQETAMQVLIQVWKCQRGVDTTWCPLLSEAAPDPCSSTGISCPCPSWRCPGMVPDPQRHPMVSVLPVPDLCRQQQNWSPHRASEWSHQGSSTPAQASGEIQVWTCPNSVWKHILQPPKMPVHCF